MPEDRDLLSKPPLNYLVNPDFVRKHKPWDINISSLLDTLLSILKKSDSMDLRLCGSAAISSALIYRLKVESLFFFEKLRIERKRGETPEPPGFLELPFRYELSATSIDDLMLTLGKIIKEILSDSEKEKESRTIEIEPVPMVDSFSTRIKELLTFFRQNLLEMLRTKEEIFFSEYIKGYPIKEAVQSFILLLLVATESLVSLEQVGEDIKILKGSRFGY